MSRRIDIELTSALADGSWTWRAAGARKPNGQMDGSLLPPGSAVGDILKVEVEQMLDENPFLERSDENAERDAPEPDARSHHDSHRRHRDAHDDDRDLSKRQMHAALPNYHLVAISRCYFLALWE